MSGSNLRRLLHVSTASVLLVGLISWELLGIVLTVTAFVGFGCEFLRLRFAAVRDCLRKWVPVFRQEEAARVSGAAWLAAGYAVAGWVPAPGVLGGILVSAFADPAASLVGSRLGKSQGRKTAAGSLAALVVSFAIAASIGLNLLNAMIVALVAVALERWPVVNDNLSLAPGVAAAIWVLS